MAKLTFTQESIDALYNERLVQTHILVRRKLDALYLLSQGLSRKEVQRICRLSARTLANYVEEYRNSTLQEFCATHYKGQPSKLHAYADELRAYFSEHPPRSVKEAQAIIKERTGLERSQEQVRVFLRGLGFRPLRAGLLPAKADAEKQEEFKKKSWSLV